MGVWGTGIFSDDNASDLREDYRRLIGDGVSGPEATDRLLKEWSPEGDPALEPVFWLALAVTQWVVLRMLDPWTDLGGTYPVCELLDWRGPDLPAGGIPDSTAVRRQRDRDSRIMILPIGKRLVNKDRIVRLNVKHSLAEDYSRKPRGAPNPTRVATWGGFDEILTTDYGLR